MAKQFNGPVTFVAAVTMNSSLTTSGTNTMTGGLYARGGVVPPQANAGALVDDNAVLTAAQMSARVLTFDGSAPRTKATDTAANIVSGLGLTADNDSADFYIINTETTNPNFKLTLSAGSGVTLVGSMVVQANAGDSHQTHGAQLSGSASAGFRIQRRGASAVHLYRIS